MRIAIIGCGFAGLSSALFLSERDAHIDIFDKFNSPEAVGAGILIQPSSQEILKKLNIFDELLGSSEKIFTMQGINHKGKEVFLTRYLDYSENAFGMGVQRSSLFNLLYRECSKKKNIKFHLGYEVYSFNDFRDYDLIIVANGTHSKLRSQLPIEQNCRAYPYGCIWTKLESDYSYHKLSQYVRHSREMFGVLPSGRENNRRIVSVFWSLPANKTYDMHYIYERMQSYLRDLPGTESLIKQIINSHFNFSTYCDVYMKHYNYKNIVVIGDAAHAMSPQLGQGANMALLDSYFLNKTLDISHLEYSLEHYSNLRKRHLRFYSQASRFLTPLFQSDSTMNGIMRDYLFGISKNIGFSRKMSSQIMCGKRQSWLYNCEIKY